MKPVRDPKYLSFIRRQPCAVCDFPRGIEAHHTGQRGMSQKADDSTAIPLCRKHHEEFHRVGKRDFITIHGIDLLTTTWRFQTQFREGVR